MALYDFVEIPPVAMVVYMKTLAVATNTNVHPVWLRRDVGGEVFYGYEQSSTPALILYEVVEEAGTWKLKKGGTTVFSFLGKPWTTMEVIVSSTREWHLYECVYDDFRIDNAWLPLVSGLVCGAWLDFIVGFLSWGVRKSIRVAPVFEE